MDEHEIPSLLDPIHHEKFPAAGVTSLVSLRGVSAAGEILAALHGHIHRRLRS